MIKIQSYEIHATYDKIKKISKRGDSMGLFSKKTSDIESFHTNVKHLAIIMDGNGRWATKKKMPRIKGHYEGMQNVKKITQTCHDIGVEYLTLYAFSTENWKRPEQEVNYLMKLPGDFMDNFLPDLMKNNIKVRVIGDLNGLPPHTKYAVQNAIDNTEQNSGMQLIFALNYGSRHEIVTATKKIVNDAFDSKIDIQDIDEQLFATHLFTHDIPDPELLIRTSGEQRISNFLLWQLSYSEFIFVDDLWPDFDGQKLIQTLKQFNERNRRFGGL
ncbi:isoprenyl transferase [Abyssicoccus albus]|nr:isoprenyl transferase [Abyssicoccus albus]